MTKSKSLHAEATLHRKLDFMEENHNEMYRQLPAAFTAAHRG